MYLVDTNVISEARKNTRANPGVSRFFADAVTNSTPLYLSAVSVGELRRGVELIRRRGDAAQARSLAIWLTRVMEEFADNILPFDSEAAQIWGLLRASNPAHALDKQIAAIALVNDLTVATCNTADFHGTGVRLIDPFLIGQDG